MSYISYVPSSVAIDGLDVDKYDDTQCRKNVMRFSKLEKYML